MIIVRNGDFYNGESGSGERMDEVHYEKINISEKFFCRLILEVCMI